MAVTTYMTTNAYSADLGSLLKPISGTTAAASSQGYNCPSGAFNNLFMSKAVSDTGRVNSYTAYSTGYNYTSSGTYDITNYFALATYTPGFTQIYSVAGSGASAVDGTFVPANYGGLKRYGIIVIGGGGGGGGGVAGIGGFGGGGAFLFCWDFPFDALSSWSIHAGGYGSGGAPGAGTGGGGSWINNSSWLIANGGYAGGGGVLGTGGSGGAGGTVVNNSGYALARATSGGAGNHGGGTGSGTGVSVSGWTYWGGTIGGWSASGGANGDGTAKNGFGGGGGASPNGGTGGSSPSTAGTGRNGSNWGGGGSGGTPNLVTTSAGGRGGLGIIAIYS